MAKLINKRTAYVGLSAFAILLAAGVLYDFYVFSSVKTVSVQANYMGYTNSADLEKSAEIILVGRPLKKLEDRQKVETAYSDGTLQDFYTLTELEVEKVLKNTTSENIRAGKTFVAIEPIVMDQGLTGKTKLTLEDYSEMKENHHYLLFLKAGSPGIYGVINMNNGKFDLDQPEIMANKSHSDIGEKLKADFMKKYDLR
ncbi:hypothetical protein [Gorillibacterium sp. sgz500922]|uniref:hypothetical protein n=1 Tax=Gorillibacterium sp. sgz500922 TaxID=3446694 RepID=UPI003F6673D2